MKNDLLRGLESASSNAAAATIVDSAVRASKGTVRPGYVRPIDFKHGRVDMVGRWVDFSGTPTVIAGPPPVPGQHSREILRRFGWADNRIEALLAANAVFEAAASS